MLTAEERRALVNKPLPPVGCVRVYGGKSYGGGETYERLPSGEIDTSPGAEARMWARRIHGGRRPSLSEYEGG